MVPPQSPMRPILEIPLPRLMPRLALLPADRRQDQRPARGPLNHDHRGYEHERVGHGVRHAARPLGADVEGSWRTFFSHAKMMLGTMRLHSTTMIGALVLNENIQNRPEGSHDEASTAPPIQRGILFLGACRRCERLGGLLEAGGHLWREYLADRCLGGRVRRVVR